MCRDLHADGAEAVLRRNGRIDVFNSFVDRVVSRAAEGVNPLLWRREDYPRGGRFIADPTLPIRDGRAALFQFGYIHGLTLESVEHIHRDANRLRALQPQHFRAQRPGNVTVEEDLINIQDEVTSIAKRMWMNGLPTLFHVSLLYQEGRGQHILDILPFIADCWTLIRQLGAGDIVSAVEHYQFQAAEQAGPAVYQLLTPPMDTFETFILNREEVIKQAEADRPFYLKRWTLHAQGNHEPICVRGVPLYYIKLKMPPSRDWLPSSGDLYHLANSAPFTSESDPAPSWCSSPPPTATNCSDSE